jgi:hypothetical protein
MKNVPRKIWLQTYDPVPTEVGEDLQDIDFEELHRNGVVTWESEQIHSTDIEYEHVGSQWRKYAEEPPTKEGEVVLVVYDDGSVALSRTFKISDGSVQILVGKDCQAILWMPFPATPEELKINIKL